MPILHFADEDACLLEFSMQYAGKKQIGKELDWTSCAVCDAISPAYLITLTLMTNFYAYLVIFIAQTKIKHKLKFQPFCQENFKFLSMVPKMRKIFENSTH